MRRRDDAAGPRGRPSPTWWNREVLGWAMFDVANSAYTTVIVTVAFGVYFTKTVAAGPRADLWWGVGTFTSAAIVVLASPWVGAVADALGAKKRFLAATWLVCAVGTASLALVGPGDLAAGLTLFVVSYVAFLLGENLVSAFLPEIAAPEAAGRVSGLAWGLGYLGGLASLVLVLPLLRGGFGAGNLGGLRTAWVATGAFVLVAGVPTFLLLPERAPRHRLGVGAALAAGLRRLRQSAAAVGRHRQLARFLGAFFLFQCGLAAVIAFSAVFAERVLSLGAGELTTMFVIVQLSSAAGAFAVGAVVDRIGARPTVAAILVGWIAVCGAAATVDGRRAFLIVALVAGAGIGSLQSAVRAVVALLAPPGRSAEAFGFWGLAGKSSMAVGPLAFGALSSATGSMRAAVVLVAAFFALGLVGVLRVDVGGRRGPGEAPPPAG